MPAAQVPCAGTGMLGLRWTQESCTQADEGTQFESPESQSLPLATCLPRLSRHCSPQTPTQKHTFTPAVSESPRGADLYPWLTLGFLIGYQESSKAPSRNY